MIRDRLVGRFLIVEIRRIAHRESLAIWKRLPRFAIRACSAPVQFRMQESADLFLRRTGRRKGLLFVNSLHESGFVSRVAIFLTFLIDGENFLGSGFFAETSGSELGLGHSGTAGISS